MTRNTAKLSRLFLNLNEGEKTEFAEWVTKYQSSSYLEKGSRGAQALSESTKWLGPIDAGKCDCCGK